MCNRHGVRQPEFTASGFEAFESRVEEFYDQIALEYIERLSYYETAWVQKWSASKQQQIRESQKWDVLKPGRVKNMVKRESQHTVPKKARCIQFYPNFATQAEFGPEFTALQKAVMTVINNQAQMGGDVTMTFASGMNAAELGAWLSWSLERRPNAHYYERDGKSWDATMAREHHELKKRIYRCAGDKFLAFVEACFDVKGSGMYNGVRMCYKLRGTCKSGHNDTTLGNSIVNAAIAYCAMVACGLKGDIIVAGDDLLIVIEGDFDEVSLARVEQTYGITPEYRKFSSYHDVSFISGVWFANQTGYVFTPKPGRLLRRLFWTTHPPPPRQRAAYINGIVLGLMPTCRGMPVVSSFLGMARRLAGESDEVWYNKESKVRTEFYCSSQVCDNRTFEDFMMRYRLTRTEIEEIEQIFNNEKEERVIYRNSVVEKIEALDLADLMDRPTVGDC